MKIESVIAHLVTLLDKAKANESIHKPMSYALYYTWKWCDEKEKPRVKKEKMQCKQEI